MSNEQLFLSLLGTQITISALFAGFLKYYIDAKIDPIAKQMDILTKFIIEHSERIATLEEKTKKL